MRSRPRCTSRCREAYRWSVTLRLPVSITLSPAWLTASVIFSDKCGYGHTNLPYDWMVGCCKSFRPSRPSAATHIVHLEFSDRHGRTRVLGISVIGLLSADVNFIFVNTFWRRLPGGYWFLVVGPFIEGLLGGSYWLVATMHVTF